MNRRMRITISALAAVLGAVLAPAMFSDLAYAQNGHYPAAGWQVREIAPGAPTWTPAGAEVTGSAVTGPSSVELVGLGTPAPPHYGVEASTPDLDLAVEAGDHVEVSYALSGASPAAGAIRLFAYDEADADTLATAPDAHVVVPADSGLTGTLTLEITWTGQIGTLGLVYDSSNSKAEGSVTFSNLAVAGTSVLFRELVTQTTAPSTTAPATTTPPATVTTSPSATVAPQLPVTGSGGMQRVALTGAGLLGMGLLAVGGSVILNRRQRHRATRSVE